MHELPIMRGIIKTVSREVNKNKIRRVSKINIVVGDLSSMVDDSMEYYFDMLSKNTLLDGAVLNITRTRAIMICSKCNSKIPADIPLPSFCTKCQSKDIHIDGGAELFIDSIEVKDEDIN